MMIPALRPAQPSQTVSAFLAALSAQGFEGETGGDASQRVVGATDNSIYHVPPAAVLFPRSAEDVVAVMRLAGEPRFRSIVFAPRGGGTGTNGQSLTDGVVVDLSRHMTRILEIDPVRRRVRVEPGVVKDQLNAALKPHGLFFAPELSTSNRATIGGMIATDASGQGSCLYGKTHDHVRTLTTVLVDGSVWTSSVLDDDALEQVQARDDRIGEVHRVVDRLHRSSADLFRTVVPELNRNVTGFDLVHVRDGNGRFDLNAVLCGSEGTLDFIVEAELSVLPIPACAALLVLRYGSFDRALRDARDLMATAPASIETIDAKVLALARGDASWRDVAAFFPKQATASVYGINIVEYVADSAAGLDGQVRQAEAALALRRGEAEFLGFEIVREPKDVAAVWDMRKKAVGLLGNMSGPTRPIAFVEDTAVPPERLADFIAEFRDVLDRHGLSYGMFGHVDAGVLHVRPALDLTDPGQRALIRTISDEVERLTRAYGGVLWGEHGKGVRSEYAPVVFGPLYPAMQAIKAAFDPANRLNPGKIATPSDGRLLRIDEVPMRGAREGVLSPAERDGYGNAFHCNGNGLCFDFDADAVMCPSYKGTRDRRHSPKGRASLMREWLLQVQLRGGGAVGPAARFRDLPRRALNTLGQWLGVPDFSHEVMDAMDGCLSCKGCVGQCPIKVDVPAMRATFMEAYHGRYLRSPVALALAWVEHLLPLLSAVRPLYRGLATRSAGRRLCRVLGLAALPPMPPPMLRDGFASRGIAVATPDLLSALAPLDRDRSVCLVVDLFTRTFDPAVALDAADLLSRLGYRVWLAPPRPSGKALHVQGMLGPFRRTARRHAAELQALAKLNLPLVGLDPALTLIYRDEYARELGAGAAPPVQLIQEWLVGKCGSGTIEPIQHPASSGYTLLPHCAEQATAPASLAHWRTVFSAVGLTLVIERVGCCGMAGTFGHEARHRAVSDRIYSLSWGARVEGRDTTRLLATGYSCRSQAKLVSGSVLRHPVQALLSELREAGS